jgi:hypothetical protein
MRKREVIEPRKVSIKLKPIHSYWKQAAFYGSIIARSGEFNRDPRTWRVLHSATAEQERSCVLRESGMRRELPQGGSDRKGHRKSDEFVVVKKLMKVSGAKGLGWYRVVNDLLSQIIGWK